MTKPITEEELVEIEAVLVLWDNERIDTHYALEKLGYAAASLIARIRELEKK